MAQPLHLQSSIKLAWARAEDHAIFNLGMHWSRAVVFGAQATTAQLYPGRVTFEFDQGHMTKKTNHNACFTEWKSRYITMILIQITPNISKDPSQP